ncbi:MAG: rhomboid family intramembrane serine protease [Myxococcales bacterium]|nr:rhomboid family intramembrane serine protease [Myxococcales bacterium]
MPRVMFQLPPARSAATVMAVTLIAASVAIAIFKPLATYTYLVPEAVFGRYFVWEVLTYAFVEATPLGVIFGGLIIWSIGGALEAMWGRRRFLWFSLGVVVAAAIATLLLSLAIPALVARGYPGGGALTGTLWVAYGLHLGRSQANFWGFPMTGNMLALLGAAFVFLNAAFSGLHTVIPEAFALLFTWFLLRVGGPGALLTRFRSWQLERDLKKRSAHLKSLEGGRGGDRGSDKYLH